MTFDHVGVLVADLATAKAFARDVLALGDPATAFEAPEHGLTGAFYAMGEGRLELFHLAEPGDRLAPGEPARIDHVAVLVDDLDAEMARLAAEGVTLQGPQKPDPIDAPVELRGRRHLWTQPATSLFMLPLIKRAG